MLSNRLGVFLCGDAHVVSGVGQLPEDVGRVHDLDDRDWALPLTLGESDRHPVFFSKTVALSS
jgi:hypothetical protein